MERETGIEPATNSLEGCDSTTELLPPCSRDLKFEISNYKSDLLELMTGTMNATVILSLTKRVLYQLSTSPV
jgi:hypothetical protein